MNEVEREEKMHPNQTYLKNAPYENLTLLNPFG